MDKAWIKYDPISLELKAVTWSQPTEDFLEIDKATACDFISGKLSLLGFCLNQTDNGQYELVKIEHKIELPKFWNLKALSDSAFTYTLDENKLEIYIGKQKQAILLFCTIKDQPWWLIKSWVFESTRNITLDIKGANTYSWYIGGL